MAAFALIPGFPVATFLVLGAIVGGSGLLLIVKSKRKGTDKEDFSAMLSASTTSDQQSVQQNVGSQLSGQEEISLSMPLMIDIDAKLQDNSIIDLRLLNQEALKVRRALYLDLGVPFPGIHLRFNENIQTPGQYSILMQEVPVATGNLRPGYLLYADNKEELSVMGLAYEEAEQFLPNVDTIWIEGEQRQQLDKLNLSYMEPPSILACHLSYVLKRYSDEFIGIQETSFLFEQLQPVFPDLLKEAQRVLPIHLTTEVFQRLVNEDISIRNIRLILESLVEWGQKEKDPVLLTEYVRGSLKRYISYKYANEQNILSAYLLDQDLEETIRGGIRQTSSGNYLALDPGVTRQFIKASKQAVGDISRRSHKPVLITAMDIRRYVRKMLEIELYDLAVLSFQELTQEITVQPLAKITI